MQYWDEGKGFHTAGNRLPQNVVNLPHAVTDTPEVQAARNLHFKIYERTVAQLMQMQNTRPIGTGDYGGLVEGTVLSKPQLSMPAHTEDDDDEVIIDSQTLPDDFNVLPIDTSIIRNDNRVYDNDGLPNYKSKNIMSKAIHNFGSMKIGLSLASSLATFPVDSDSVIIENVGHKSISKRSIDQNRGTRTGRKMGEIHRKSFYFGPEGNVPILRSEASQLPSISQPFIISSTVFSSKSVPSTMGVDQPVSGKLNPEIKGESLKSYSNQIPVHQPSTNEPGENVAESQFSPVAHKFAQLLSLEPEWGVFTQAHGPYVEENNNVYRQQSSNSVTFTGGPLPYYPFSTSPNTPNTLLKFNHHPAPHQKLSPLQFEFDAPTDNYNTLIRKNSNAPDFSSASHFYIKTHDSQEGPFFLRPIMIPTSIMNTAPIPPSSYPYSSQSFIHENVPVGHNFFNSRPVHYFPKSPPNLTYNPPSISHISDPFYFPYVPQLSISRPSIGQGNALLNENIPYDISYQPFPGGHVASHAPIPATNQLLNDKQKVPSFGGLSNDDPYSKYLPTTTENGQKYESNQSGLQTHHPIITPEPGVTDRYDDNLGHSITSPEVNIFEKVGLSSSNITESHGLHIIVTDSPLTKVDEPPNGSYEPYSEIETSTGKLESNQTADSNESNNFTESPQPSEIEDSNDSTVLPQPSEIEPIKGEGNLMESQAGSSSSSNEENKADSALIIDGRLSEEETTPIIESITEESTEEVTAATLPTDSANEIENSDGEKSATGAKNAGEGTFLLPVNEPMIGTQEKATD